MTDPEYQFCLRCGKLLSVLRLEVIRGRLRPVPRYCDTCEWLIVGSEKIRMVVSEHETHST